MKKTELFIVLLTFGLLLATGWAGITSIPVPTTATTVVAATGGPNANKWVVLQNNSTNDIYIKLDSSTNALTITNGIKLSAGASMAVTATGPANPTRNEIKAISATGTNNLTVQYGNEGQ